MLFRSGRPVAHIASNLVDYNRLVADLQEVIDTLAPKAVEVFTPEGKSYTMRIQPYRTMNNVIEGAVITFVDVTELKRTEADLRKSNDQLAQLAVVVRDAHDAITVQDLEGRILAWNPAAVRMYGWTEAEALRMNVRERIPAARQEDALAKLEALGRAEILKPYHTQRITKDGAILDVCLTATALLHEAGEVYAIATTERTGEGCD